MKFHKNEHRNLHKKTQNFVNFEKITKDIKNIKIVKKILSNLNPHAIKGGFAAAPPPPLSAAHIQSSFENLEKVLLFHHC